MADSTNDSGAAGGLLKIGLIGGLSFPSTITYYDRINRMVNQRLGRAHSPRIVLDSLDFQPMVEWLAARNGPAVTDALVESAERLEAAGADFVAICCNTVHEFAADVESRIRLPLVNICRCTADEAARRGAATVGLLGSSFSMEEAFYRDEFEAQGMKVAVPAPADRAFVQNAIETELPRGDVSPATRERFLRIARDLLRGGADVLVLACTEIPLVIRPQDIDAPLLDTVEVHTAAIVAHALGRTAAPALTGSR
ncbi:aspartate/glutamate racemase family protein [Streptomyces sp. NPDC059373]